MLQGLIEAATPSWDFADLELPLTAVAADVNTGHHVELTSGDPVSALMGVFLVSVPNPPLDPEPLLPEL